MNHSTRRGRRAQRSRPSDPAAHTSLRRGERRGRGYSERTETTEDALSSESLRDPGRSSDLPQRGPSPSRGESLPIEGPERSEPRPGTRTRPLEEDLRRSGGTRTPPARADTLDAPQVNEREESSLEGRSSRERAGRAPQIEEHTLHHSLSSPRVTQEQRSEREARCSVTGEKDLESHGVATPATGEELVVREGRASRDRRGTGNRGTSHRDSTSRGLRRSHAGPGFSRPQSSASPSRREALPDQNVTSQPPQGRCRYESRTHREAPER